MFEFHDEASQHEKCYVTVGQLPRFVDPKQPPTKKSPFSAILSHSYVHTTELILPREIYNAIWESVDSKLQRLQYAKVILPLSSLLEGEFFNKYIKTSDVLMISEGRSGVDDVFSLRNGILRLELGRESYEKSGLSGKPIRSGGRKHAKERYLVEINLRLPSMLHGKKGFERIVWAFKNALTTSVTWLFCDLSSEPNYTGQGSPLEKHHPTIVSCSPLRKDYHDVLVPPIDMGGLVDASQDDVQDLCQEFSEWIALVSLGSPRVVAGDSVDPYLSRYSVPQVEISKPSDLVSLKWRGLIPSHWISQLFTLLLREMSRTSTSTFWFAFSSNSLGREAVESKDGYTIISLPSTLDPKENPSDGLVPGEGQPVNEGSRQERHFICCPFIAKGRIDDDSSSR
ncbi:hypothetical protein DTO212C5_1869 [Paecilomyces variotii]|nr:hypothetical protein DTO212C5_1869 [Paecilomyces variotii]